MGRIARAFSFNPPARRDNPLESPGNPMTQESVRTYLDGGTSDAGVPVTESSSLRLGAVWRCASVLAEGIGTLPCHLMEREGRGARKATDHPLFDKLSLQPNERHTSSTMRKMMMANLVFHGNAYAIIRRDRGGSIRELWPIPARKVKPKVDQKSLELYYEVEIEAGTPERWDASEMLHIPGLNFDGLKGLSVLGAAREAIGSGLGTQKYGNTLFARGGRVPGIIKIANPKVDPETRKTTAASWDEAVGGQANFHRPAIFPKGWEYQDIGIKPDEAQWLETKKFNVVEVCRFFGVNPHKIFDFERATFTNFEHSSLSHVVDTILPWAIVWEQEMDRKLLTPEERKRFFVKLVLQALMRGDTATRAMFYASMRQWGAFSANDVLELEDRPGIGPQGDIYLVPFNMTPADQLAAEGAGAAPGSARALQMAMRFGMFQWPPAAAADPAARADVVPPAPAPRPREEAARPRGLKLRRKIRAAQQGVIEDRAEIIVKKERGAIEKELKQLRGTDPRSRRDLATLRSAIDEFYKGHAGWAGDKMHPILNAYASLIDGAIAQELGSEVGDEMPPELVRFAADYSTAFGKREASEGRLQLLALVDQFEADGEEAVAEAVQERLNEWGEKRAKKIALNESVQFMAASAKTLYVLAGITILRWVANAGACDFCQNLDGKTSSVTKNFVDAGTGVQGGPDSGGPMVPSDNIGHPPMHGGCECDLVAD